MLTGSIAGCLDGGEGPDVATTAAGLEIADVVYCAEQPDGYDDYETQPDATYEVGDVIWIYVDVRNIATEDVGGGEVAVHVAEDLTVRDSDDETVLDEELTIDQNFPEGFDRETFFIVNNVTLPMSAGSGDYTTRIALRDQVSGNSASTTAAFSLGS